MMNKNHCLVFLCFFFLVCSGFLLHLSRQDMPQVDVVAINRICQETARQFEQGSFYAVADARYAYAVLDTTGQLLFQTVEQIPTTVYDAVRLHDTVMDVTNGSQVLGKVLAATSYYEAIEGNKRRLLSICLGLMLFLAAASAAYLFYLQYYVLRPFQKLKDFARHIAMGNLELPLKMDRDHAFGPFTESFDMMREQLMEARQQEERANQSKKELVASLSHDIKTPVTSIKLISELLLVTQKEEALREKLKTINQKSEQIDLLISNMLHSTLEDLGELKVAVTEESSILLEELIHKADYNRQITMDPVPRCLISIDPLRMEQVFDNVINNAYKYAGTRMRILSQLEDGYLRMEIQDFGNGVSDEEIPMLFQKFYRGSNARGEARQGSGLGLYISQYLMDKMGGEILVYNRKDGLSVELLIRLV